MRSSVDLPAPLGPTTPSTSPSATVTETPARIVAAPCALCRSRAMRVPATGPAYDPAGQVMAPEHEPVVFISHTTQDNRDSRLAPRLARGLKERGAGTWIAPDDIPAGDEWQEDLVTGVMDRSTHFLVVLSAASTRAHWVLDEIRLARQRYEQRKDLRILPLPVGKLGKYANSDFLGTLQQVAYHDDFHAQLESVVAAVGLRPTVPDTVSAIVADKTRDFVGRDYVFEAIERFLTDNPNGYLTIEGDPGIGKSAILASFVKRTGCI